MINSTCTAKFAEDKTIHFLSVASSYVLGRSRPDNEFLWTGYSGLSHENLHDILYFFEPENCINSDGFYNITMTEATGHVPEIACVDEGAPIGGLHLGNFAFDIARSVQQGIDINRKYTTGSSF